jgi:hypothetical protein
MFRILGTAALLGFLSTAASAATVIDSFTLDVTSAAGTDSGVVLAAGENYLLTVSGTFLLGNNPTRHIADAEFFNLGSTPLNPIATPGVGVDGADVDFGPFNASHVYTTRIVGDGSTINVFFADSNYGDNSGSLEVSISTVPLPAGMALMLTGLGALGAARRRKRG